MISLEGQREPQKAIQTRCSEWTVTNVSGRQQSRTVSQEAQNLSLNFNTILTGLGLPVSLLLSNKFPLIPGFCREKNEWRNGQ